MASQPILRYFEYGHLTHKQARTVAATMYEAAHTYAYNLPDCPETSAGLRKLLEAKDCFVRAALELAA